MGYRSDVIFACTADAVPILLAEAGKSAALKELLFADADEQLLGDYDSEGSYLFSWSGIKWYDSYEGVAAIQDFLDWCDGEDVPSQDAKGERVSGDECYRFVRIGEEVEDIEERGSGFWDVGVRRSIEF